MKKVLVFFSVLLILFILFIPINSNLFAQEENIEEKVEEILDSCHTMGDPYKSDLLAELGSPAVPVLIEKLQGGFSWTVVEALGKIGDKSATPILLERLGSAENSAQELAIINALAMIGDSGAEAALLSYFEEEQSQDSIHQLEVAQALLKVAGETSKQEVKKMVSHVRDLYQRAYWTFDEESLEEIFEEFISSPFDNEEIIYAFLASLIIDLKDPDLINLAIKYRQLSDESGPRFVDGFKVLLESGDSEAIETVYKFAENDEDMWPPAPPDIIEEEKELYFSVHPIIRVSAVEALLELEDVDMQRVTQAFEDISLDDTYDVPVTVKFDPEQWDYSWKDEEAASGVIICYLGNLPDYDVAQIKADTIKMNNQIGVTGEAEIVNERKGFLGEVLKVEFDRSSVLDTMQSVWPGAECLITISGELNDGNFFSKTVRVQVTDYTEVTLGFPSSIQYSDILSGKATLTYEGSPLEGKEIEFNCMLPIETLTTDANGEVYNTSYKVGEASGAENYSVCANFYGDNNYLSSYAEKNITVEKEDAILTYTGDTLIKEGDPAALIYEIQEEQDGSLGDIKLVGPINFKLYKDDQLYDTYQTDIIEQSPGYGVAQVDIDLPIGIYEVEAELDNSSYYNSVPSSRTQIAVYDSKGIAIGTGSFLPDDNPKRIIFGFAVRYKRNGQLKGIFGMFDENTQDYYTADSFNWMIIEDNKAYFSGYLKINGRGSYPFILTVEDNGSPGKNKDKFKIDITVNDDHIIYDELINKGNIFVHKSPGN